MRESRFLGLGLMLLLVGCAGTVQPYELSPGVCNTWDADDDGLITQAEFAPGFDDAGIFGGWDEDDSGLIDEEEFGVGVDGDDDFGAFDTWDTNDNFGLDATEFRIGGFNRFDANDDGTIGLDECRAGVATF